MKKRGNKTPISVQVEGKQMEFDSHLALFFSATHLRINGPSLPRLTSRV